MGTPKLSELTVGLTEKASTYMACNARTQLMRMQKVPCLASGQDPIALTSA